MSFFTANHTMCNEKVSEAKTAPEKLRYVISKDGSGRWIKPVKIESYELRTDYDEDVPF